MSGLFGSAAQTASNTLGDLKQDVELGSPPEDSISDVAFNPNPADAKDFLAVASWDKKVRVYEILSNGQGQGKVQIEHDGPVFSCDFFKDGQKVLSAGADKMAKVLDLATGQSTQVAQHEAPICSVRYFETNGTPMAVTGSWDKTVKYWDFRASQPAASLQCQERVYTMDVRGDLLVIGTADRYINVVNLKDPTKFYKTLQSPLKWQTRVVSCFSDQMGFAIGSIEGRCAIQYVEDKDSSLNFSFKCHRDSPQGNVTNVHSVNDISFHPVHGTFSTAGSDGTFHFWDKDAKHRLKGYPNVGGSIATTAFNKTGSIFAYAISYDWSKGFQGNSTTYPTKVMLHPVQQDECKPRPSVKKR
ncbi:WD40-repeat-containing domain protein [Lasiosphaeria hispida]|uniref:WD40-repeat-containing domain protein n=1 Tax=Lasiosphaeria hispida TaxID=260671 RepID=A0AAJ0HPH4_9PEZI|nr:WD40-repeat-containing domain protein [Lasiosphaeria hispida]